VDPTDPGGQFIDRGEHNTAAIYYTNETEKAEAERQIEEINLSGRFEKPVVTPVLAYKNFFPAEDYHQDFYKKRAIYYKQYARGSGREDYVRAAKLWYAKHRS
jgi:peptide-methionine (S)-S-oxide reductase